MTGKLAKSSLELGIAYCDANGSMIFHINLMSRIIIYLALGYTYFSQSLPRANTDGEHSLTS